jgi:hypothetical protein
MRSEMERSWPMPPSSRIAVNDGLRGHDGDCSTTPRPAPAAGLAGRVLEVRGARGRLIGVAGIACLAIAAIPSVAAGASDDKVRYVVFQAEGSNGYHVQFVSRGSKRAQRAQIWTDKGREYAEWTTVGGELVDAEVGQGSATVIYDLKRARSIGPRVEVEMGPLGRISARFRTARVETSRRPCVTVRSKFGHLAGDIRFTGEGGYSSLDESSIRARLVSVDRRCGNRTARGVGRSVASAGPWRGPSLLACGPTSRVAMFARREKFFGDFLAVKTERTDVARITRVAGAIRLADSFTYRRDLQSAKLRPEPPFFLGEARYADGALSGDLRARFPGVGWTALSPGVATLFRSDPDPLPCEKVFDFMGRSAVSSDAARVPIERLRSRLAPPRLAPLRAVSSRMRDEIGVSGGRTLAPVP